MSYQGKKKRILPSANNSKKIAERIHAKKRISERLGFEITSDTLKSLSKLIQSCRYISAERQTNKRTKVRMIYPDTEIEIFAIYDRKSKNVVTVWKTDD